MSYLEEVIQAVEYIKEKISFPGNRDNIRQRLR